MKVVVTGASGYIGRHVLSYLSSRSEIDVLGIISPWSKVPPELEKYTLLKLDLENIVATGNVHKYISSADCLIHLAYRNGFNHYHESHFKDLSWHYSLIEQCVASGCNNINVMGTVHEVGYWEGMVDSDTPCNPITPYGIAKNALRQALFALRGKNLFSLKWLRGYYVYGNDENSSSIFGKILSLSRTQDASIDLTDGVNQFDFTYVEDLARMIAVASTQVEVDGIVNVCSGVPIPLKKAIVDYVSKNHLEIQLNFGKYPQRVGESHCVYGDNTLITQILNKNRV